jgi:fucose 4-O-acetylase-like acetyltransferase/poly-gamma-glutamate capsule biosynthesis protein CapA/YwtB (metallophosphatase superfamily)/lysophospholipase L1-like esterase
MTDNTENRSYFLDNAKGILIFLVVFGHFILPFRGQPFLKLLADFIYIFHMPAFVFISGYLSKFVSDQKKSQFKLLTIYLFFNYLLMLFSVNYLDRDLSLLTPYFSYWYLIALLAWRYITPIIAKHPKALPLSLLISLLAGYHQEIGNQLALSRIIGFYPFFLAGYLCKTNHLNTFIYKRKKLHRLAGAVIILACFIITARLSLQDFVLNDLLFFPYESSGKILVRIKIILACIAVMTGLAVLTPQTRIRLLSQWGRNSLSIYVLHRYIPFLTESFLKAQSSQFEILIVSLALSIVTTIILGIDKINQKLNRVLNIVSDAFLQPQQKNNRHVKFAAILFIVLILAYSAIYESKNLDKNNPEKDLIHKMISPEQQARLNNCVEIAFIGDLILLRDQVREAYCSEKKVYNFNPVFTYAAKYFKEADFCIGVLEGPLAGSDKGYSTSNFDDNIPLYLNFPDSFAEAIKNAGINLVTLANNHLLDMKPEGTFRTLKVLDNLELKHVGAYKNEEDRQKTLILEIKGLKIAFLAYTYPSNYYPAEYFFETNKTITGILVDKNHKYFDAAKKQVQRDFEAARRQKPDFIFVLPHMGTQFVHQTDDFQKTWNKIFIEEGADVVLGDHSHAVQPVEFRTRIYQGDFKTALIVNCPGNFVNSYIKDNGDATAIVKIFLDPEKKEVICAGIIPMWTQSQFKKIHRALPIYDIYTRPDLNLSLNDIARVKEVQQLVTKVMLGTKITSDQMQKQYFLFPDGYYRTPAKPLQYLNENPHLFVKNPALKLLQESKKTVFVGDSLTDGCKNGGYGWFEPLIQALPDQNYLIEANGGATIKTLLKNSNRIASHKADLYVIAIGTNDIRYRNPQICAMTSDEYIAGIDSLVSTILTKNPDANFIFVAPWPSLANDPFNKISTDQKAQVFNEYTQTLQNYCQKKNFLFADPTTKILKAIDHKPISFYLKDHIHPNALHGIEMYSQKFIDSVQEN